MKRKIISIGIVGFLLLTALFSSSIVAMKFKTTQENNLPDFVISDFYIEKNYGKKFIVKLWISNIGSEIDETQVIVSLFWDYDEESPYDYLRFGCNGTTITGPAGSTYRPAGFEYEWDTDYSGTYSLIAIVDPENMIEETREDNNNASIDVTYDTSYDDLLDQKNDKVSDVSTGDVLAPVFADAQSFVPTLNILTRIKLYKWSIVLKTDSYAEVALRNELDGNNIAFTSVNINNKLNQWIIFDFVDTAVVPGETYYLVFCSYNQYSDNASVRVDLGCSGWSFDGDPYDEGMALHYDWLFDTYPWEYNSFVKDYLFKTFGRNGNDGNHRPDAPSFSGPESGGPGVEYQYTVSTNEPDGDRIYYIFDWGDGNIKRFPELDGTYVESGKECVVSHSWSDRGDYLISVKAVDEHNSESVSVVSKMSTAKYKNMRIFLQDLFIGLPLLQQILDFLPKTKINP